MEAITKTKTLPVLVNSEVRKQITDLEARMRKTPGALVGHCYPLKHTFGDGIYVRQITMPKGLLVISAIHKYNHPYFVLKGDVSVLTEEGVVRIKAPYSGMTKTGTKRLIYVHEETVWTTVHVNPNNERDIEKLEEMLTAKDYDELDNGIEEGELLSFVNEVTKRQET